MENQYEIFEGEQNKLPSQRKTKEKSPVEENKSVTEDSVTASALSIDSPLLSSSTTRTKEKDSLAGIKYYCVYCEDRLYTFIDHCHDHWKRYHSDKRKPFRFGIGKASKNQIHLQLTDEMLNDLRSIDFGEVNRKPVQCVCPKCKEKIDFKKFPEHYANHAMKHENEGYFRDELEHEYNSTKVLYSNGLIVYKDNLTETKASDFHRLEQLLSSNWNPFPKPIEKAIDFQVFHRFSNYFVNKIKFI